MKKTTAALLIAGAFALAGSTVAKAEEASAFSAPTIPDWTAWKCDKVHTFHEIIETYGCYEPGPGQTSRILFKVKGSKEPFLIGWGYDERAANPTEKAYAALYKAGQWIVGARGTGFTTKETSDSITFYVFLDDKFSAREKVEIILPQADKEAEPVTELVTSSGNQITLVFQIAQEREISTTTLGEMHVEQGGSV